MERQEMLRGIPKVDELMQQEAILALREELPTAAVRAAVREELEGLRRSILAGEIQALPEAEALCGAICRRAREDALPSLRPVINGTGVVLHTNLGRACLSQRAADAVTAVARGYSTLEYDLAQGQRGSRHDHIETLVCQVTGAEAAMVVNNNAAARSSPPGESWWRSAAPSGSRRSWSSAAAPSGRWVPPTRPT